MGHLELRANLKAETDNIAQQNEFVCSTNVVKSERQFLKWICREGHEWDSRLIDMRLAPECPICLCCKRLSTHIMKKKIEFLTKKGS